MKERKKERKTHTQKEKPIPKKSDYVLSISNENVISNPISISNKNS